jgi:hypothetical protein
VGAIAVGVVIALLIGAIRLVGALRGDGDGDVAEAGAA